MLMVVEVQSDRFSQVNPRLARLANSSRHCTLHRHAMSHAAPLQPAEHTSMQLEGSAIDAAAVDPAAATAAAALAGLSAEMMAAAADVGQSEAWMVACLPVPTAAAHRM